jgi:hypothetical protein
LSTGNELMRNVLLVVMLSLTEVEAEKTSERVSCAALELDSGAPSQAASVAVVVFRQLSSEEEQTGAHDRG